MWLITAPIPLLPSPKSQLYMTFVPLLTVAVNVVALPRADYDKVIMAGNNLARDIRGANQLGLISVWLDWSPRYPSEPTNALETPHYTISRPIELLDVIDDLEMGRR